MRKFLSTGAAVLVLALSGAALSGCIVTPGPGGYYAAPAPVYVGPSYYYGPRYGYWGGYRGGYRGGYGGHGGYHGWH